MHVRQQLREAMATVLDGSVAGLWNYVFETRVKPSRDIYNFLLIYWDTETVSIEGIHPTRLEQREVSINIDAYLKPTDDEKVEDDADAIATELETLLTFTALNAALGNKLKDIQLVASSLSLQTDENDRTAMVLSLEWLIRIFTIQGQPETLK